MIDDVTYEDARQEILLLMSKVRDIIDLAPEEKRDQLWDVASDDLHDAMTGKWSPPELSRAFFAALHNWKEDARLSWQTEPSSHSVKVPPKLTVVKGDGA